ncbi:MAG: hypothetical protein CFE31_18850 [Rhizobiales bacterium PAR1]|nr:MAG: hypothetical protein CFE31_18850 [Rhizobiales bacterium PAR1]
MNTDPMSPLALLTLLGEAGTVMAFTLYLTVLGSMHREARTMPLPRLDPVSLALQAAAKYGFRLGILAVILCSLFYRGLT